jgi:hypothetical protein
MSIQPIQVTPYAAEPRAAVRSSFDRVAGICGIAGSIVGLGYAIAFVVLRDPLLSALFLMAGGLLMSVVLPAIVARLGEVDADWARLALLFGVVGAIGAAIHGGYDLANALHPPMTPNADLPNAVDPRGLLTFGIAGLGTLVIGTLMMRSAHFPRGLCYLGFVLAALLIALYLGRLIILDAAHPLIVIPAIISGFLVNPLWNLWLGLSLLRGAGRA